MNNYKKQFDALTLADKLAVERTHMANERTFLSYGRSSLSLLVAGITIIRIDLLDKIYELGIVCVILAPLFFSIGLWRYRSNKKTINRHYAL